MPIIAFFLALGFFLLLIYVLPVLFNTNIDALMWLGFIAVPAYGAFAFWVIRRIYGKYDKPTNKGD